MEGNIVECTDTNMIVRTASVFVPISKISGKRKVVLWRNDQCSEAIKNKIKLLKL